MHADIHIAPGSCNVDTSSPFLKHTTSVCEYATDLAIEPTYELHLKEYASRLSGGSSSPDQAAADGFETGCRSVASPGPACEVAAYQCRLLALRRC